MATGVQVGAATVATRFVLDQSDPVTLALLRYGIGVLCLLPAVLLLSRGRIARRDLLPVALLGIGQFAAVIVLLNIGLQYIASGRAALLLATFPALTMAIAAALGLERLTVLRTGGVLLTLAGVALVIGEKAVDPTPADAWIGELSVLGAALSGAVCSVAYRPYLRRNPTLQVSAVAMLAAVVFLAALTLGLGAAGATAGPWPRLTPGGWSAVVFIGVSSGIGYFLWLWALDHISATRVTAFIALSPVTAALLGAALLGETVTGGLVAGTACVALGLVMVSRRSAGERAYPR